MLRIASCLAAVALAACAPEPQQQVEARPEDPGGAGGEGAADSGAEGGAPAAAGRASSAGSRAGSGGSPAPGTSAAFALGDCPAQEWCWAQGLPIRALHRGPSHAVFAVGAQGTILEWTDAGWRRHDANTRADLVDVFVAAPDDVWVVAADSSVLRYDGRTWTAMAEQAGMVTGTAPDDVWLGTQHFDGQAFSDRSPGLGLMHALLPIGPRDVWALGLLKGPQDTIDIGGAVVMHYDGERWTQVGERLRSAFWGGGLVRVEGEVWAYNRAEVVRHEAAGWVQVPGASNSEQWQVPQITKAPGSVVLHDGERFTSVPEDTQCLQVVSDAEQAWCFGPLGRLFHFDGSSWVRTPLDPFGSGTLPDEAWGRVPPVLWAGAASLAWGTDPQHVLRVRKEPNADPDPVLEVLQRYDDGLWVELRRGRFQDISGSAADDIWIAGDTLLHYDGRSLTTVETPAELGVLSFEVAHALGPSSAWFVARRDADATSLLLRYDGGWSVAMTGAIQDLDDGLAFEDIAGTEDALWVVGTRRPSNKTPNAMLFRYDGSTWHTHELWQYTTFTSLETRGDRLWLQGSEIIELPTEALSTLDPKLAKPAEFVTTPFGRVLLSGGRLWIGEADLWSIGAEQAMRRPF